MLYALGQSPSKKSEYSGRAISCHNLRVYFPLTSRQIIPLLPPPPNISVILVYIILCYNSLNLLNCTTYAKFNDARFLNDGSEMKQMLKCQTLTLH
jgi:hypothetical protein